MKRKGKIARLPHAIRERLNLRLQDNEPGDTLLAWLNGQETVQTVLKEQFEGAAITKQNLSEWRTGGFAEWVLGQAVVYEAQDMDELARRLDAVTDSSLPDRLATVVAGRYASLLARWDGEVTEEFTKKLRALGSLCREICALRRSHHNAIRVKIAQELHAERKTANGECRVKNEELGERSGRSDESESVKAGQTSLESGPETSASADVATGCRHPGREMGKVEGGMMDEEFGTSDESKSVAPSPTTLPPHPEVASPADVATSCHHPEPEAGKAKGRMMDEELEKSNESESVAPGQTTARPNSNVIAFAEVTTSGRQPQSAGKPLANPTNSYLNMLLAASRAKVLPVQPPIAPLPDWKEEAVLG